MQAKRKTPRCVNTGGPKQLSLADQTETSTLIEKVSK